MQTDPKTIKKHFKSSIDKYSEHAVVQKIIAEKLAEELEGSFYEKILELGAGTGFLTEQLSNRIKFNEYYANDLVEKSEKFVRKYINDAVFFCGDFRRIKFNQKFDLIASNAVFQWFENMEKVFDYCKNNLKKGGILAFSTFSPNNFKEFKDVSGLGLEYKTANEIIKLLEQNFEIIKCEQFEKIISFDNPLKILTHMKNTGVNSLSSKTWSIIKIKNFCNEYSKKYPNLELTYSPIILVAKLK